MNEDTIFLLKECNSGCKSATNSMEQMLEYVEMEKLYKLVKKYNDKHIKIGDECHELLNELGEDEKDPNKMAMAFAWFTTEMRLMINDHSKKIAELLMDGCNMGIQSISEAVNKYPEASKESHSLAKKLVKTEQDFMNDLKEYL